MQAFVEGGVAGTAAKAALLSKLAGCWGDVALQAAGSFFLEKAYAWAVSEPQQQAVLWLLCENGWPHTIQLGKPSNRLDLFFVLLCSPGQVMACNVWNMNALWTILDGPPSSLPCEGLRMGGERSTQHQAGLAVVIVTRGLSHHLRYDEPPQDECDKAEMSKQWKTRWFITHCEVSQK
jgi:hypothetical protein